ncbi:MAG: hypothetical protein IKN04_13535 [Clostridia bacterium]|nr:hypothetical protein [Clostridia bacterium]
MSDTINHTENIARKLDDYVQENEISVEQMKEAIQAYMECLETNSKVIPAIKKGR